MDFYNHIRVIILLKRQLDKIESSVQKIIKDNIRSSKLVKKDRRLKIAQKS